MLVEDVVHLVLFWSLDSQVGVMYGEFDSLRVDGILHNWETSLHCMLWNDSIVVSWSPPFGDLKFNVDGAAKGKPGPAGVGGVLRNSNGAAFSLFS